MSFVTTRWALWSALLCTTLVFALTLISFQTTHALSTQLKDGDLVQVEGDIDVWILKTLPSGEAYRRLILNPAIFESYGHLKWENIITVSQDTLRQFTVSNLVREVKPDGSIVDGKVYVLFPAGDTGVKRHLQISGEEFLRANLDPDSIFDINHLEASDTFYKTEAPITSVEEYHRLTGASGDATPSQGPADRTPPPQDQNPAQNIAPSGWTPLCDNPTITHDDGGNQVEICYRDDGSKESETIHLKRTQTDPGTGLSYTLHIDHSRTEKFFRRNGVLEREKIYRGDGQLDIDSFFDENGQITRSLLYRADGSLWQEITYKPGSLPVIKRY